MRRVTLRGLRARKLRTALTAFAIVLGVAMVTGSSVLGATMKRSFDIVFSSAYAQTDVVVSGKPVVDWSESSAPTLPTSTLERIRAMPGVERAAGAIFDFSGNSPYAIVVAPNGKKISGDPSFVMGFEPEDEQFNPLRLREGRWAAGDGEVVLDASTADGHGVKIGDTVKIAALTPCGALRGRRHRSIRQGQLARRGDDGRLRRCPWRSGCCTRRARSTSSRSPPPTASGRRRSSAPAAVRLAHRAGADGGRARIGRQGGDQPLRRHHHVDPARLRRRRPLRRRLRDRQHAVDHRGPAHARARDAAPDRRHAEPGAAGGRARVARDRRARLARRRRGRGGARRSACGRCSASSTSRSPRRASSSHGRRCSSGSRSASS